MDRGIIENLNHEWSPPDPSKTRRLKVIIPQCFAALAIFAVNLSNVIFEAAVFLAASTMSIGSKSLIEFNAISGIGLLVGGIVAQFTGARVIVMLAGVVSIAGWITLGWVSSIAVLKWMFCIATFTKAMMQAPSYVYLTEISQPNMRNALIAAMCPAANIGMIYVNLELTDYTKTIAFLSIVFALFGLVSMFFLPDSPYRLANKGRYPGVELSLAWFRGRTSVENVKPESKAIIGNAQNSPTAFKLFFKKSLYVPALIVCSVFLASAFVRIFFATYFSKAPFILYALGYGKLTNLIFILFGVYTILVSIFFISLVAVIGKRKMILMSLFGGSISILVASIAGYLGESKILTSDAYSWIFLICLSVAYFFLIVGVVPIPLILNGELFPSKLRNLGAGFGLFFIYIVQVVTIFIYDKYFLFSHGAILTLALASTFGFIMLLWLFPQYENKSLVEIEQSCTSINELRRKK